MADTKDLSQHQPTFDRIKEVRAQAIHHTRLARQFAAERRDLMQASSTRASPKPTSPGNSRQPARPSRKMLAC